MLNEIKKGRVFPSERDAQSEFILRIRENPEYELPAGRPAGRGRGHDFERLRYISGTESSINNWSSLMGTPIPHTKYGTNAGS